MVFASFGTSQLPKHWRVTRPPGSSIITRISGISSSSSSYKVLLHHENDDNEDEDDVDDDYSYTTMTITRLRPSPIVLESVFDRTFRRCFRTDAKLRGPEKTNLNCSFHFLFHYPSIPIIPIICSESSLVRFGLNEKGRGQMGVPLEV